MKRKRNVTAENTPTAKYLAMDYLSYKSRTEKEVRDKLASYGEYDGDTIEDAITFLKARGYVDDERYAIEFAKSKRIRKLDGSRKIVQMLIQKGIDEKIARDAVNNTGCDDDDCDETANAVTLIRKRAGGKELDYSEKRRIYAFLARKGYTFSVIKEAFSVFGADLEGE